MSIPGSISSSRVPDPALHYKVVSVVAEPRAATGGINGLWTLILLSAHRELCSFM